MNIKINYATLESPLYKFYDETSGKTEPINVNYKTIEYREKVAEKLLDYILDRIMIIEKNGFEPEKVVLGEKEYDILLANYCKTNKNVHVSFGGDGFLKTLSGETFNGLEIVLIPEKTYCKVVCNVKDEFLYKDRIREDK